ncbi:hypothetical protein [Rhizobium leguminosarum]|uniref:hypothetical protein n=1 Tax=Rhizobium leguminosarum TaxID=384 RepID=UPI001C983B80|nr:hypothetical protein [Rhizobium leguminosarum]MBY5385209.1 hypothetical protein [Rhizobium leguminosarum]
MPHHGKGPYLVKRKARRDKEGNITHRPTWIIRDGRERRGTGCSIADFDKAKKLLEAYKAEKYTEKPIPAGLSEDNVYIADLIRYYLDCRKDWLARMKPARRRETATQFERLNKFWGLKTVAEINTLTSKAYQEGRTPNTVRLELIMLRAAINFGASENKVRLVLHHNYAIPPKPDSRPFAMSLQEVITLYKAARRRKHMFNGVATHNVSKHIARFILVAIVTGTRADRLSRASFHKEPGRPWIDLASGIFYRRAAKEFAPHNKRADPVRIPDRLLRLMKLWYRDDSAACVPGYQYLIHYHGRSVDCRRGYYTLKHTVFGRERATEINRHTLKHTCVTWLLSEGVDIEDVATYVSTTPNVIRTVYRHLLAGKGKINEVFSKKRVGSRRTLTTPPDQPHLKLVVSNTN